MFVELGYVDEDVVIFELDWFCVLCGLFVVDCMVGLWCVVGSGFEGYLYFDGVFYYFVVCCI